MKIVHTFNGGSLLHMVKAPQVTELGTETYDVVWHNSDGLSVDVYQLSGVDHDEFITTLEWPYTYKVYGIQAHCAYWTALPSLN